MICKHCGLAVFWAFSQDRYLHTGTRGQHCRPGGPTATPRQARR